MARDRRDDAVEDFDDEMIDDEDAVDADDEPVSRGGTTTRARPRTGSGGGSSVRVKRDTERLGIFGRIGRFIREVIAEMRKVIWPTRKELITYTAVVIVFVTAMLTIVGLLDLGFAKAVLWVFGNNS